MTYQLYTTVGDYTDHKWVSTVKEEDPDINGTKFPSIIVCNINRLKDSKVKEYNMSYDMVRFLFHTTFQDKYIIKDENTTAALEFYKWQKAHNLTYLDIFEKMAPKCEDIFIEEQCSEGNITPVQTLEYGRCYRWETNELATSWGAKGAEQLILNTQGWDYVPIIENNYLIQGLAIQLSYTSFPEYGDWIKLQPGTHTSLSMQIAEASFRLPSKSSVLNPFQYIDSLGSEPPCSRDPQLKYFNDTPYSVVSCFIECYWILPVTLCNCIPFLPSKFYRTCDTQETYSCLLNITGNFTTDDVEANFYDCTSQCPEPCVFRYVEATTSQTTFPSDEQRPELEKWLAANQMGNVQLKDVIVLEFYFGSLEAKV
uniref:Uncharacterized protein n=1 Tax=Plectus sambesii TaxID=2011161 RepID=A0A914UIF0_9BILA